jgi:hypothetical protein
MLIRDTCEPRALVARTIAEPNVIILLRAYIYIYINLWIMP